MPNPICCEHRAEIHDEVFGCLATDPDPDAAEPVCPCKALVLAEDESEGE